MKFGICQIIYIGLMLISLGIYLAKHGEPKTGTYSFWTGFISFVIEFTLLYFGGFFG